MAIVRMDYYSISLLRTVSLTAYLPVDKAFLGDTEYRLQKPFKTLYFLHGLCGNDTSVPYDTLIFRYAKKKNIAVICPEGDNHYYVDCDKTGEQYGKFIGTELVELTRKLFPLSTAREDTYIGGISMGGYGSFRNALKYWNNFGGVISLGTGVRYKHLSDQDLSPDAPVITDRPGFFEVIHGDLDKVAESDMSLEYLIRKGRENKITFPRIYMGCGEEDSRVKEERELVQLLKENQVEVEYDEVPGGHDSRAWDVLIEKAFDWWLPERKYRSIIFDLDGVICSTDEYHYAAWKRLADSKGIPFDREINNRLRGVSRMESLDIILERAQETFSTEEKTQMAEQKNEIYKSLLWQMNESDLDDGMRTMLSALREKGYKLAIGSSSKNTKFILERIGLGDFFDAVSDGTCIEKSKPDPEVFLKAAEMLGESPSDCLVIEDAKAGIAAANRGGFDCAGVGEAARCETVTYPLNTITELARLV